MAHQHSHQHQDSGDLRLAFFLNVAFAILEIIGGLAINSVAILSDALHDLGDSFSLGLAWGLQQISQREGDQRYTYGYRRFSLLGALINAVVLIGGSLFVLSEAIPRLMEPEAFSAPGMIAFAVVGIAVNGFAAYRLQDNRSSNAQVVGLHLLEDVLGWVAVLIAGVISLFVNLPILDPILSILITLYILFNVVGRLRDSLRLFLQAVPEDVELAEVDQRLSEIDGVHSIHHTHIWSLDGEHNVLTTHLVVADSTRAEAMTHIRQEAIERVHDLELEHTTIQIERESEACTMRE